MRAVEITDRQNAPDFPRGDVQLLSDAEFDAIPAEAIGDTIEDLGEPGGGDSLPDFEGHTYGEALILNDQVDGFHWADPPRLRNGPLNVQLDDLTESLITGITKSGSAETAGPYFYDGDTLYSGSFYAGSGNINVSGDGVPGGVYTYLTARDANLQAGEVTISGSHELAVAVGGDVFINGGSVTLDSGGEDAYSTEGGWVELNSGNAFAVDGVGECFGSTVRLRSGSSDGGGGIEIVAGGTDNDLPAADVRIAAGQMTGAGAEGSVLLQNGAGSTAVNVGTDGGGNLALSFFGQTLTARPSVTVVDAAHILEALVALGLMTDDS